MEYLWTGRWMMIKCLFQVVVENDDDVDEDDEYQHDFVKLMNMMNLIYGFSYMNVHEQTNDFKGLVETQAAAVSSLRFYAENKKPYIHTYICT